MKMMKGTSTAHHTGMGEKGMTPRGEPERMKKTAVVQSSGGLMKHNVTPKKGKGEF